MGHRIPCAAVVERLGMGHQSTAHDHMTDNKGSLEYSIQSNYLTTSLIRLVFNTIIRYMLHGTHRYFRCMDKILRC